MWCFEFWYQQEAVERRHVRRQWSSGGGSRADKRPMELNSGKLRKIRTVGGRDEVEGEEADAWSCRCQEVRQETAESALPFHQLTAGWQSRQTQTLIIVQMEIKKTGTKQQKQGNARHTQHVQSVMIFTHNLIHSSVMGVFHCRYLRKYRNKHTV